MLDHIDDEIKKIFFEVFPGLSETNFDWKKLKSEYELEDSLNRYLYLKVRREILNQLIEQSLPWGNVSSGYQMRFDRVPNVYNQKFWTHFTNKYICRL